MEIVVLPRERLHLLYIFYQHIKAVGPGVRISGAEVHGIAAMSHQFAEFLFRKDLRKGLYVLRNDVLGLAASGVSGKPREGTAAKVHHLPAHSLISVCNCKMTSDVYHSSFPLGKKNRKTQQFTAIFS